MLSGEVDVVTSTVCATIPHVNGGRLRALAVMAPQRVPVLQAVPTTAEAGMPELVRACGARQVGARHQSCEYKG
jgi:tripartite-type tricarboxylate transporter receptor subunit TctC